MQIVALDGAMRLEEDPRILSGTAITGAIRATAKHLIATAEHGSQMPGHDPAKVGSAPTSVEEPS